jgi:hypothetical protein
VRLCGVLIWYDESPTFLATAVAGFARVCDHIVAVDGAFLLYPGARPRSHPDQAEAILSVCEAADVGCTIHRPQDVFRGGEVEKRNLATKLAGVGLTSEDWLCIFDADNHVMKCDDPQVVRGSLEATDLNVATYTVLDGTDWMTDPQRSQIAIDRAIETDWTVRVRAIYRWTDDLRYVGNHYTVCGTYDDELRWLFGPEMSHEYRHLWEPCLDLDAALVICHRRNARARVRRDARDLYYKIRDEFRVEQSPLPDAWLAA